MGKIIFGVIALIVAIGVFIGVGSYISYYNYGVTTENALLTKQADNQQLLGKHSTQIGEMAQVADMQRDDLAKVYRDAMEGRYGDNGSTAVMQWIKEQNPTLDPTVYNRLQQRIEANREQFANAQKELLDMKNAYQNQLDRLWSGFWLKTIMNFPRKFQLEDIKIITSTHSNKAYETGVDDGVQLRK